MYIVFTIDTNNHDYSSQMILDDDEMMKYCFERLIEYRQDEITQYLIDSNKGNNIPGEFPYQKYWDVILETYRNKPLFNIINYLLTEGKNHFYSSMPGKSVVSVIIGDSMRLLQ